MGLKEIYKVANYYDVKYGFTKEAQDWEALVDNPAFKPRVGQELWSEEYKRYMKWDGTRWNPQLRHQSPGGTYDNDPSEGMPYQSVWIRNTKFYDDRTGLEYTIDPLSKRKVPVEREGTTTVEHIRPSTIKPTSESSDKEIIEFKSNQKDMPEFYEFQQYRALQSDARSLYNRALQSWKDKHKKVTDPSMTSKNTQVGAAHTPKKSPGSPMTKKPAPTAEGKRNWTNFQDRIFRVKRTLDDFISKNPTSTTLQKYKQRLHSLNQKALSGQNIEKELSSLEAESGVFVPQKRTYEPEPEPQTSAPNKPKKNPDRNTKYETAEEWTDTDKLPV